MPPTVYVETTVISYLTSRPSRDIVVAGHQETTREWWQRHLPLFQAFISPIVMEEISRGEPEMAQKRVRAVESFELLEINATVEDLADVYYSAMQLPERARADAYHVALAASHGIDFLVTWNCSHLASGFVRKRVDEINFLRGIRSPTICTPEELMEVPNV